MNRLIISFSLLFTAFFLYSQEISVSFDKPIFGEVIENDSLRIRCSVTSLNEILAVTVTFDGVTKQLWEGTAGKYKGFFSLSGYQEGNYTLFIQVEDVEGNIYEDFLNFTYDTPPVLNLDDFDRMADPYHHLQVSCYDEGGGPCHLQVVYHRYTGKDRFWKVITGINSLDTLIDISRYPITAVSVSAKDSYGHVVGNHVKGSGGLKDGFRFQVEVNISPYLEKIYDFSEHIVTLGKGQVVTYQGNLVSLWQIENWESESFNVDTEVIQAYIHDLGTVSFIGEDGFIYQWSNHELSRIGEQLNGGGIEGSIGNTKFRAFRNKNDSLYLLSIANKSIQIMDGVSKEFTLSSTGAIIYTGDNGALLKEINGEIEVVAPSGKLPALTTDDQILYYYYPEGHSIIRSDFSTEEILYTSTFDSISRMYLSGDYLYLEEGNSASWRGYTVAIDLKSGESNNLETSSTPDYRFKRVGSDGSAILGSRFSYSNGFKGYDYILYGDSTLRVLGGTGFFNVNYWNWDRVMCDDSLYYAVYDQLLYHLNIEGYQPPVMQEMTRNILAGETLYLRPDNFEDVFEGSGTLMKIQILNQPGNGTLRWNYKARFKTRRKRIRKYFQLYKHELSMTYLPDNGYIGGNRILYRAFDGVSWSDTATIQINILDVNSPQITGPIQVSVDENNLLAGSYSANEGVLWTVEGPDKDLFKIKKGNLSFLIPPDFENPSDVDQDNVYQIEIVTTDKSDNVTRMNVGVLVNDVDEIVTGSPLQELAVKIYPNPTASDIIVEFGDGLSLPQQPIEVSLIDLQGIVHPINVDRDERRIIISPLQDLSGVYILMIGLDDALYTHTLLINE